MSKKIAQVYEDCCWCIPVRLTKELVCKICGHQWRETKTPG